MEQITIRQASINDLELLQEIGRQTFSETFSAENSAENMTKYLEESFAANKLGAELNNKDSYFYFAVFDHRVIGYLKLNTGQSQTEAQVDKALEIERIYVLQEFHGKKVGQLLYDKAMEVASQINASYVWLGVWEQNLRALKFYMKNGFVEFDKHIFRLGNEKQTDLMMKKVM
ncbi:GNAT family N-acetyltransferase [Pedobacter montanisoli]|uniref:GNAT family N-acetyltransferase n=1 Tax=Pedobacter montanisoli TaxID=2923277 RepID=A0ABS9ZRB9_9SPHI|nr:GNAT family N-acetyltransferase [Pedobacter montanisoli]MCJ0741130.1 GNAT family N-acetyltransferase [Pedobacter montanisoli]